MKKHQLRHWLNNIAGTRKKHLNLTCWMQNHMSRGSLNNMPTMMSANTNRRPWTKLSLVESSLSTLLFGRPDPSRGRGPSLLGLSSPTASVPLIVRMRVLVPFSWSSKLIWSPYLIRGRGSLLGLLCGSATLGLGGGLLVLQLLTAGGLMGRSDPFLPSLREDAYLDIWIEEHNTQC